MKNELFRSVASGLLVLMVGKSLSIGMETLKKVDVIQYKQEEVDNWRGRWREKWNDFDSRLRVCEVKLGDSSTRSRN